MRARFVGDPRHDGEGPETVNVSGFSFVKGVWTPVTAQAAAMFARSSHFEVDTDGDGKPGPTVEDLRYALTEKGVKFHHKAGIAKLQALLAEHEG